MTKQTLFEGSATAIVTPFRDGGIDYESFGALIDFQIENGTDALVVLGTTGESATISESERYEIIAFAKRRINGRVPLIVGSGTNNTQVSIRYSKSAQGQGADGLLIVTPYYNKATERGLIEHYSLIAKSVDVPIILYNVPSRTGVNVPIGVYKALSSMENIVGIKEASGKISITAEIIHACHDRYDIYSGCDDLTLPILSLGGKGVISVVSNILPKIMHTLCHEFLNGNHQKSTELQLYLMPLIKEMFCEVNPIPIKTALYLMGKIQNEFRLPLCQSTRLDSIESILQQYNLIK